MKRHLSYLARSGVIAFGALAGMCMPVAAGPIDQPSLIFPPAVNMNANQSGLQSSVLMSRAGQSGASLQNAAWIPHGGGGGWHGGGGGWHGGGGAWHGGGWSGHGGMMMVRPSGGGMSFGGRHAMRWNGDWRGHHHRHFRDRDDFFFDGGLLGFGLGLPVYGGLYDDYYDYGPDYYAPYYYAPRYRVSMSSAHVRWCESRYRSYRPYDNTFQPNYGPRRQCVSPYD